MSEPNTSERTPALPRRTVLAGAVAAPLAGVVGSRMTAASPRQAAPGRYAGKVVLITGATSGIGAATARAFAAEGASVTFCGRRQELGAEVEQEIRATGGEATYIAADVRDPAQVEAFITQTVERYGGLDIAFNNAGIQTTAVLHDVTVEDWDDSMNTNARGVFLAMKFEIPHLIERGGGVIVVNSSVGAVVGRPNLPTYQATKRAVLALVASAALEYGSVGIRVNAIMPGVADTALIRPPGIDDATWEPLLDTIGALNADGLKRVAQPEEIASAVLALCSDELAYMTGAMVPVDGGITAGRPLLLN